jgi:hypothetical protein
MKGLRPFARWARRLDGLSDGVRAVITSIIALATNVLQGGAVTASLR